MPAKKKQAKPKWSVVIFGAFIFVSLFFGLITAFYAGAQAQLDALQQQTNANVSIR